MENTVIDFESLSCKEKFEYLNKMLKRIKPECFNDEEPEKPTELKPLGDFWINLKNAKEYIWDDYDYDDFVIGLWTYDPNKVRHSASACDRNVGFPKDFNDTVPNATDYWDFGGGKERPDWFTQANINEGHIWVKPLFVHKEEN